MIVSDDSIPEPDPVWEAGVASDYRPEYVARRGRLADAGRAGDWEQVFAVVGDDKDLLNAPRVGSTSGFAALHQAAWHGADTAVVTRLLDAGAWRCLRTAEGQRPAEVANARGHHELVELLEPRPGMPRPCTAAAIETYLHALITVRSQYYFGPQPVRPLPQVEVIWELSPDRTVWCPIPGMYGGFALRWAEDAVISSSWSRVVGGSGQEHRVTENGVELVREGFV